MQAIFFGLSAMSASGMERPCKSQRANPLARTRPRLSEFSKIRIRNPDHNFGIAKSLRIREQNSHTPCHSVPACRESFLSANHLQSPGVSLVSESRS